MGKCPERASPSPPAVVGTFPYNLLNGTAGEPPSMGIQSPRSLSHVVMTTGGQGSRAGHGFGESA